MTYRPKDSYHRRARAAGYRARSAYKLIELADRFRLLRRGDHVVDLGAWPGGWLQVAVERIGADGRAVGVDVVPIDPLPAANVDSMSGDVRDPAVLRAVRFCRTSRRSSPASPRPMRPGRASSARRCWPRFRICSGLTVAW